MPEALRPSLRVLDFRSVAHSSLDLVGGCGTISIVRIWLAILTFAFVVISSRAEAQVFKPRGGKGGAPAKTTPAKAPAAKKAPAARKTDSPSRVATKAPKKSRAAEEARPSDLTPKETKKAKKAGKADKADKPAKKDSADIGDDEVIITDDDD